MTGRKIDLEAETDSTHREILAMLPNGLLTLDDIPAIRAMIAGQPADFPEGVLVEDTYISGLNNDPDERVRLYKPIELRKRVPWPALDASRRHDYRISQYGRPNQRSKSA